MASERHMVAGVPVFIASEMKNDAKPIVGLLDAAAQLLSHPSVRPRKALGHYIQAVLVGPLPHIVGEWNNALRACYLDSGFVSSPSTTPVAVASVLIHEAQHARIARLGVAHDERTRLRVERLCVQAQLDFAQLLPDHEALEEGLRRTYEEAESIWDRQRLADLRIATVDTFLGDLKAPSWVRRLTLAIIRRRAA